MAVHGVGLDVPGLAQGTAVALEADPEILPLLRGVVRMDTVLLDSPDFRVRLPAKEKKEEPVSLEEIEEGLSLNIPGPHLMPFFPLELIPVLSIDR